MTQVNLNIVNRLADISLYNGIRRIERAKVKRILKEVEEYNSRLSEIDVTKDYYESLTEYENRVYNLDDGSVYDGSKKTRDCNYVFSPNDILVDQVYGDDGTGVQGDESKPFATVENAILSSSLTGGFTIWVGSGTYSLDSGSLGYGSFAKEFVSPVVIKSKPNETVVLTHSAGSHLMQFIGTNRNFVFEDLTLRPTASASRVFYSGGSTRYTYDFEVRDCVFENTSASNNYIIQFDASGGNSNHKVKRCNIEEGDGTLTAYFSNSTDLMYIGNDYQSNLTICRAIRIHNDCQGQFYLNNNKVVANSMGDSSSYMLFQANATISNECTFYFSRNYVRTTGRVFAMHGRAGRGIEWQMYGNDIETTAIRGVVGNQSVDSGNIKYNKIVANNVPLGVPDETVPVVGSEFGGLDISDNYIISMDHGVLMGENGLSNTLHDNIVDSSEGLFGVVMKGVTHISKSNVIYGGSRNTFYLKDADGCSSTHDVLIQRVAGGNAIEFNSDPTNNSITNALVECTAGSVFETGDIGTGNEVNSNTYSVSENGSWGTVFNAVTSRQDVVDEWSANYPSNPDNDNNSKEV